MPQFSAHLTQLFTARPFAERGFAAIDGPPYRGWVGREYRPAGRTEDGREWMGADTPTIA